MYPVTGWNLTDRTAAVGGNSFASLSQRLTYRLHVPAVGVKQRDGIAHDSDVALPEYEIATRKRRARVVDSDGLA